MLDIKILKQLHEPALLLILTMPTQLFDLPPEILLQILSTLPINHLLRFAQTSQFARSLAYSNLHNLSLAVYPSHRSSWHNKLFTTQQKPQYDRHRVIQIPQAWDFDYSTLLSFHNKIITSILNRHAFALQRLELTLWTISMPIARALASLQGLRELTVRIEATHSMPRAYMNLQRKEECRAWDLLASTSSFMNQVQILTLEGAEITAGQLSGLLSDTERPRELRLSKCDMLTSSIWSSPRLAGLQHLSITDCVNVHVNEMALETISKMHRLQVGQPQIQDRSSMQHRTR